ncbi:DUF5330 domain-containing protein [Consotaella aegiceratis]|uniref:DUF5330 domain-containing protein n=1 Tax=Consotaella aegiceratis TaxID=3097961 RepID=UPI002F420420
MRFILKSAFWLGLAAFLIPSGGTDEETGPSLSVGHALVGVQQALQDLTGFCDRAPDACTAGRDMAAFAGERIGDGMSLAYQLVQDRMAIETPAEPGSAPVDPVVTAGLSSAGKPDADTIARILAAAGAHPATQPLPAGVAVERPARVLVASPAPTPATDSLVPIPTRAPRA